MGEPEEHGDRDASAERAFERLFSPEFRNRLDGRLQFQPLTLEVMEKIVGKLGDELTLQLAPKGVRLETTAAARRLLAERGYDPAFGARPLARLIEDAVKRPLTQESCSGAPSRPAAPPWWTSVRCGTGHAPRRCRPSPPDLRPHRGPGDELLTIGADSFCVPRRGRPGSHSGRAGDSGPRARARMSPAVSDLRSTVTHASRRPRRAARTAGPLDAPDPESQVEINLAAWPRQGETGGIWRIGIEYGAEVYPHALGAARRCLKRLQESPMQQPACPSIVASRPRRFCGRSSCSPVAATTVLPLGRRAEVPAATATVSGAPIDFALGPARRARRRPLAKW